MTQDEINDYLIIAINYNNFEQVKYWIEEKGASLHAYSLYYEKIIDERRICIGYSRSSKSAIQWSIYNNNLKIFDYLLSCLNTDIDITLIGEILKSNNFDIIKTAFTRFRHYVDNVPYLDYSNKFKGFLKNSLYYYKKEVRSYEFNFNIIDFLLEMGADINCPCSFYVGSTNFEKVLKSNNQWLVEGLRKRGAKTYKELEQEKLMKEYITRCRKLI